VQGRRRLVARCGLLGQGAAAQAALCGSVFAALAPRCSVLFWLLPRSDAQPSWRGAQFWTALLRGRNFGQGRIACPLRPLCQRAHACANVVQFFSALRTLSPSAAPLRREFIRVQL
jgi:hypothetical protein